MKILLILNDAPYGSERSYNALRLAKSLVKHDPAVEMTLFLMADAVSCARHDQKPPPGYYNIEIMLNTVLHNKSTDILLCSNCMDARGLTDKDIIDGAQRSDMNTLSRVTFDADKVLVF